MSHALPPPPIPCVNVQAALRRLGLDGDAWVRIEAAVASTADGTETHVPVCEAQLRAIVQVWHARVNNSAHNTR